ncbi:MAG: hypothetical protein EB117_17540 [Betaproteobacteria bacterium]|nr:hypothetical protein [Betaproteobacteria bacterium]
MILNFYFKLILQFKIKCLNTRKEKSIKSIAKKNLKKYILEAPLKHYQQDFQVIKATGKLIQKKRKVNITQAFYYLKKELKVA